MNGSSEPPPPLAAALELAQRGWRVFPVHGITNEGECTCGGRKNCSPGKHPVPPNGLKAATTDPSTIERWWGDGFAFNVGVVLGSETGLWVLDLDTNDEGKNGFQSLAAAVARHGELPPTLTSITGSGRHLWFRWPAGGLEVRPKVGVLHGVDVRGEGSYVVVPPSGHVSGRSYTWCEGGPDAVEPAEAPAWLLNIATGATRPPGETAIQGEAQNLIPQGERNDTLFRAACRIRRHGGGRAEILDEVERLNKEACTPPLEQPELEAIAASALRYTPEGPGQPTNGERSSSAAKAPPPPSTDYGNAERLVAYYGDKLRYESDRGRWLFWDGAALRERGDAFITRLAVDAIRSERSAALAAEQLEPARWLRSSESRARLRAMVELAPSVPRVAVLSRELDADPHLLNTREALVNLTSGEVVRRTPASLVSCVAGTSYDPEAEAPRWERFLEEVFGGDRELIEYVQRAAGYSLTADTSEQVFFVLLGSGANGKSVFQSTLKAVMGDYARSTPIESLLQRSSDAIRNDIARLPGARMVTSAEAPPNAQIDEALLKAMTGEDELTARLLHREYFSFQPTWTLWIALNRMPGLRTAEFAVRRRLRVIPFNVRFTERPRVDTLPLDLQLKAELREQYPGILRWMLEGARMWHQKGLGSCTAVDRATSRVAESTEDLVDRFLRERCERHPAYEVAQSELYEAYREWSASEQREKLTKTAFGSALNDRGLKKRKSGYWRRRGLRLRPMEG